MKEIIKQCWLATNEDGVTYIHLDNEPLPSYDETQDLWFYESDGRIIEAEEDYGLSYNDGVKSCKIILSIL